MIYGIFIYNLEVKLNVFYIITSGPYDYDTKHYFGLYLNDIHVDILKSTNKYIDYISNLRQKIVNYDSECILCDVCLLSSVDYHIYFDMTNEKLNSYTIFTVENDNLF